MALPSNYNPWSHFVSVIAQIQNRIVKEDFNDVGDDSWEPEISTPRGSLRTACTIRATDSAQLVILRLILYYIVLRKAQDMQIPVYGIPIGALQAQRKYKPQVMLYFSQDGNEVPPNGNPVTGEISWRIMNETSETITKVEITRIANLIKTHFGGTGFVWRKGKFMVSYTDWNQGLQLQILSRTPEEGERVIKEVLKVHGGSFIRKKMNVNENQDANDRYPTTPQRETILGESVELPKERPLEDVRFRYAILHVHGLRKPIHLYDRGISLVGCIVR